MWVLSSRWKWTRSETSMTPCALETHITGFPFTLMTTLVKLLAKVFQSFYADANKEASYTCFNFIWKWPYNCYGVTNSYWAWLLHVWVPEHRWYCWRWHRDCEAVYPLHLALQSWCTSCPNWWYHRQTKDLQERLSGDTWLWFFITCSPNIEVKDEGLIPTSSQNKAKVFIPRHCFWKNALCEMSQVIN